MRVACREDVEPLGAVSHTFHGLMWRVWWSPCTEAYDRTPAISVFDQAPETSWLDPL